jgi:3-oxoacyl-ACP reductase-like protein
MGAKLHKYGRNQYPEQQKQPYTPTTAAAASTTTSTTTAAAAAATATRLLDNPVEAKTVVQHFVLILVEKVL